jgi:hypothetical protein
VESRKKEKVAVCKYCHKQFNFKYNNRSNACSKACVSGLLSQLKSKYTQEDISLVLKLKSQSMTNQDIVKISGVNINKVKNIIKENSAYLSAEQGQLNAYTSKIKKNPDCMKLMRESHMNYSHEEFEAKLNLIKAEVEAGNGTVTGLSLTHGLNPNSVTSAFNKRGWAGLLNESNRSTAEQEISQWLTDRGIVNVKNDRTVVAPKEIDIYVPELKIGIEYCGLYWHSDAYKQNNYHYEKMKSAESAGVRLITIFENEWLERKGQVLNFLTSVFKIKGSTVYARKCKVRQLTSKEAVEFMDANHIQKASKRSIFHVGLEFEGELIAALTGGTHHRQGYSDIFVLDRLCFKTGYNVPGGSSRLFKSLIDYARDKGYKKIISWSDNRWSQGQVYKMLNFELESEIKHDYSYVKNQKIISKQSMKKDEIKKKHPDIYSPEKTERQMTQELGLNRIWDCGKKRWVYYL